jgi:NAD(P)-dependent dehydrogenase (short-subunit alcohol dehydrogenase family)
MGKVILVTGSSSGFGRMASDALALAGHTVYASMRETKGRNAQQVGEVESFARDRRVDLRPLELDVASEASAEAAIAAIVAERARRSRAQRRPHGVRPDRSVHTGSACGNL